MISDLGQILTWWSVIFLIGLIFLPLTKKIFANFFDRGYLFSKVIGLLFSSYLVWLLGSLKILPFTQITIFIVLAISLVINLLIFGPKKIISSFRSRFSPKVGIFIFEELLFLLALIAWSFVRGFQPNIQGLEKFMDFGFVNSILRSRYFPPADMWFAGKSINYYYFGHLVTAFLTKLSNIDSAITYNLMIATLFAFTFSLTFSLTGNLIFLFIKEKISLFTDKKLVLSLPKDLKLIILGGLISALLISLGANLHPAFYNFKMGILKKPYCDGSFFYWYPNATRYIGYCPSVEDKTIHEFPSYSFIVSDLHGHVSDIPFVLLFLMLTLNLFLYLKEKSKKILSPDFYLIVLGLSLTLAVMFMTNQWDFPIYLLVLGFTLLISFWERFSFSWKTFDRAVLLGIVIILVSILLFLPFQLSFQPIVQGIGFVRAHSLFYQLLILWGIPWFFGLSFLIFLFGKKFLSWFKSKEIKLNFRSLTENCSIADFFVLILFLTATILIIIPEIIYVKDIYIPSYHRANTMFKLTYQSFIMFSVIIGYIIARVLSSLKNILLKKITMVIYSFVFLLLMVYPFYSIKGYYGELNSKNYKGLYGLNFLKTSYPGDYAAVLWLQKNVKNQPVVLEAVGDSYTDYERISMATGLPTIEGWLVHEWLWRGGYDEPRKRAGEVQTIYESKDLSLTKDLLKKYQVKYIVVGKMEKEKYPNLNLAKISSLGKLVFESGQTKIFELP